jgi:glutathione S-transferase
MALTIYGSPRSRTMRVLWMATELGLEFSHVPLSFDDPTLKSPDFIRINRAGAVPAIVDDGYALAESLAINLYLAKKYAVAGAASLYPGDLEGEAQAWRWTLWAQAHLEPWIQRDASLADLREAVGHLGNAAAAKALSVLEEVLAGRRWLAGESFTVADLNVAAVLSPSRAENLDFTAYPRVRAWLTSCYQRPAAIAARKLFSADDPRA